MKSTKYIGMFLIIVSSFFARVGVAADVCRIPYVIGFFNGVGNSLQNANDSLDVLHTLLEEKYQQIPVEYELFYNHTEGKFTDVMVEVRLMRKADPALLPNDLDGDTNYDLLWLALDSNNSNYGLAVKGFKALYDRLKDDMLEKQIQAYYFRLFEHPITLIDIQDQKMQIEKDVEDGKGLLLVAHSQGNLFANVAYDEALVHIKKLYPSINPLDVISVIHVAPASQTSRGAYLLSDSDSVIKALSLIPKSSNNTTPISSFSGFVPKPNLHVPSYPSFPFWGEKCGSAGDFLGHGFVTTYLNSSLLKGCTPGEYDLPFEKLMLLIDTSLSRIITTKERGNAFFTLSLTWEGAGFYEFVIKEPRADNIVYFGLPNGYAGDVTFDPSNPNEVFFKAHCELTRLYGGVYDVGVITTTKDWSKKLTVKLTDHFGRVLYETRPFSMEEFSEQPSDYRYPMHLFDIKLKFNYNKGYYDISVERALDIRKH